MLGPPCATFSIARNRTMPIRSRAFPWGLPGLPVREKQLVETGNRCMQAALRIVALCDQFGVPWILENPTTSWTFVLPQALAILRAPCTGRRKLVE